jgi:hypothetical protein
MGWLWKTRTKNDDEERVAPATARRDEASEAPEAADAPNLSNSVGRSPTAVTETRPSHDVPPSNPLDEKERAIGDSLEASRTNTIPESTADTNLAERPKNPRQGSLALQQN